jgi:hypothetical protein
MPNIEADLVPTAGHEDTSQLDMLEQAVAARGTVDDAGAEPAEETVADVDPNAARPSGRPATAAPAGEKPEDVEEPAPVADAGNGDDVTAPEHVPYKQYSRLYAQDKEKDRQIAFLNDLLGKVQSGVVSTNGSPVPRTAAQPNARQPEMAFIQQAVAPVLDPVLQTIRELAADRQESKAKEALNDFWSDNEEFKDLKPQVSRIFLESVKAGVSNVSPDLILNAVLGQKVKMERQARRSVAASTVTRTAAANKTARTEQRSTAAPTKPGGGKKFSEMSTKEIEDEFASTTIWKKGVRPEDLDE